MAVTERELRYIIDSEGRKTDVILSLEEYEALLEDLYDLAMIAKVRGEERTPFEELEAELERSGKL